MRRTPAAVALWIVPSVGGLVAFGTVMISAGYQDVTHTLRIDWPATMTAAAAALAAGTILGFIVGSIARRTNPRCPRCRGLRMGVYCANCGNQTGERAGLR